jgi:hypothetical protein
VIRQRAFLTRNRHRIALVSLLGALAILLALEHSGISHDEIHDLASMCLAVVDVGALVLGSALLGFSLRRWRPPRRLVARRLAEPARVPSTLIGAMPRAGPSLLQVIRS